MAETLELEADDGKAGDFLGPYIQSGNLNFLIGSGASYPAIKTAGDIETEINDLLAKGEADAADEKALDFIEEINTVHGTISAESDNAEIAQVLGWYTTFVSLVDKILFERKNLLLPRQANVFTTNYDLFIEHTASMVPSLELNDGFDRSARISGGHTFAPERYFDRNYRAGGLFSHQSEIPTINLIKLHGSLSWRRSADAVVFSPTPMKKLTEKERADIENIRKYLGNHFVILPNMKKFHDTLMERTYYDLLRIFSKALARENVVLLCFGFSFTDEHLLDITSRALRNPTAQLVIFSYSPESSPTFAEKFAKHRNVTVVAPAAGTSIDFERFNRILEGILPGLKDEH